MELDATMLGQRLRQYRNTKGYTIDDVSEITGLSSNFIGNIERGSDNPSLATLLKLCNALEINTDSVLIDYLKNFDNDSTMKQIIKELSVLSQEQQEKVLSIITILKSFNNNENK